MLFDRAVTSDNDPWNALMPGIRKQLVSFQTAHVHPDAQPFAPLAGGDRIGPAHEHVDFVARAFVDAAALERQKNPFHAHHPADGRYVVPEARQQRIVTPAAAKREAEVDDVAFENEA